MQSLHSISLWIKSFTFFNPLNSVRKGLLASVWLLPHCPGLNSNPTSTSMSKNVGQVGEVIRCELIQNSAAKSGFHKLAFYGFPPPFFSTISFEQSDIRYHLTEADD